MLDKRKAFLSGLLFLFVRLFRPVSKGFAMFSKGTLVCLAVPSVWKGHKRKGHKKTFCPKVVFETTSVRPRPAGSLHWWIIADSVDLGSLYILLQIFGLMASLVLTSDRVMRPRGIEYAMQLPVTVSSA